MNVVDVSKLKNRISELIAIYLFEFKKQDECGGDLHVILEDGNIDNKSIEICREWCLESKDIFGVLICDILLLLGERKRWNLYLKDWGIPQEYEEKFDKYFSEENPFSLFQHCIGRKEQNYNALIISCLDFAKKSVGFNSFYKIAVKKVEKQILRQEKFYEFLKY